MTPAHETTARSRPSLLRDAGLWLSLLVVGQVAALRLMQAGNTVSYQHYRLGERSPEVLGAAAVLVVQALLVLWGLRGAMGAVAAWLGGTLSVRARVALAVAFVATSATVSKDPSFYATELVVSALIQLVALGNVVLVVRALSPATSEWLGARLDALLGGTTVEAAPSPVGVDRFSLVLALWVTAIAAVLAVVSYERHPHVPDEVVYLLQARYLAEGMLTMPAPPVPAAFNLDLMYYEPARWFSPVPPGWPFVLAVGAYFGAPWLVNPVLGGLNLLLAYALFSEIYARRTARLATLLLAASPWFLFMAMNFMTHTVTLFFALAAAVAVARARRATSGAAWRMLIGGVAIGAVSLVRPLEGLAVALLLGFWSLPPRWWTRLRPSGLREFVPSAVLAAASVATGLLVRPYNAMLTGSSSYYPIMAYIDKYYAKGSNDLGFGANRGLGWGGLDPFPGHGARDVVVNANLNVTAINVELLGWATGSLAAMLFLLFAGRLRRADRWMLAAIATVVVLQSLYWFSGGPDFGARYWYLVIIPCIALVARGVDEIARSAAASSRDAPTRATGAALALAAAALLTFVPWRAVDKYRHYRHMRPDVRRLAREHEFGRSLVLVRGKRHPDYASAAIYNPIDLRADAPVYAWDVSPDVRSQVVRAYADRPVWIVDGPTVSGNGFRVVVGPLSADAVLAQSFDPR